MKSDRTSLDATIVTNDRVEVQDAMDDGKEIWKG
jgi:hypothetical protein